MGRLVIQTLVEFVCEGSQPFASDQQTYQHRCEKLDSNLNSYFLMLDPLEEKLRASGALGGLLPGPSGLQEQRSGPRDLHVRPGPDVAQDQPRHPALRGR